MIAGGKTITVIQGEFAVSADPQAVLSTVLGSCIAVCLFDPAQRVGGMNHFLLAGSRGAQTDDLKYGINAMELLINNLLRAGALRTQLRAKVFGGARMTGNSRDIGQSNGTFALSFLADEGIPVLSQSLGGTQARRVQFVPTTGAARQMQIQGPEPEIKPRPAPPAAAADAITLF